MQKQILEITKQEIMQGLQEKFDKQFVEKVTLLNYEVKDDETIVLEYEAEQFPLTSKDETVLTVENDAYLQSCKCPVCNKKHSTQYDGQIFYCSKCGTKLEQKAFSEQEIDEARFEREMDEFED